MHGSPSQHYVVPRPVPAMQRIREAIRSNDTDRILASISDPCVHSGQELLMHVMIDTDIWPLLISQTDPFVQYAVFRLFSAVLVDSLSYKRTDLPPASAQRSALVQFLFQRLLVCPTELSVSPPQQQQHEHEHERQYEHQYEGLPSLQEQRAILQLLHNVLKHYRQETAASHPVSLITDTHHYFHTCFDVVKVLSSSPDFWTGPFSRLLESHTTQYELLALLIDLEKTRWSMDHARHPSLTVDIYQCHQAIVSHFYQLQDTTLYEPHCLRKLFELIGRTIRRTPFQQHTQESETLVHVLVSLAPMVKGLVSWFQKNDPDLDQFSSERSTTFILSASRENPVLEAAGPVLLPLVSNPEVIRQLGRVFLSGTLFILEGWAASTSSDCGAKKLGSVPPKSNTTSDGNGSGGSCCPASCGNEIEQQDAIVGQNLLLLKEVLFDWAASEVLGPRTIEVLLRIYGEDDADLSWLIRTLSLIQQRVRDLLLLLSPLSTTTATATTATAATTTAADASTTPSPLFSTSSLPSPSPSASTTTSTSVSTPSPSASRFPTTSNQTLEEVYKCLQLYAHPFETLIEFLSTIGYDEQTLLDLLLVLDDSESTGMLGALMTVLRNITENTQDQALLLQRWQRELSLETYGEEEGEEDDDDSDDDDEVETTTTRRERLLNTEYCFHRLATQVRTLHQKHLFPYNPNTLLVVLDRTVDVLATILSLD